MKTLHFSTHIDAPPAKVWDTMLNDASYREWTKPFGFGSRYEGDWNEGSTIHFLGPDPDGAGESGMAARIKENRPHEFISIEHFGIIKHGVLDTESEEVKEWAPAHENYTFAEKDGGTDLSVDVDIDEKHDAMFMDVWPKALAVLKTLAEK